MTDNTPGTKIYIIGAGIAGTMLASEIKSKGVFGSVTAFLDDDPAKIGVNIDGVPVLGPVDSVIRVMNIGPKDEALIAIPGAPPERLKNIYSNLRDAGFNKIKLLPNISQIIEGPAHLIQTREIDPQDILGRAPVVINLKESLAYLRGKRVLITGAGGSIGGEIARQLLSGGAERLYLFGHGENSIYQIDKELRLLQEGGVGEKATIVPVIGDLQNREYIHNIISKLHCDVVFHAAAYKHVPMMEENPVAAIENNVFGTKNILDACLSYGVPRFVLISTDKAVNPVSIYGVSKYICEKLTLQAAEKIKSGQFPRKDNQAYMFVRFGNVLGSRGSILPLFLSQIKKGGPVTVTDPAMTRYFMTIPEACSLVLKTGGVGENGSSYLLDMGQPLKIIDIAALLIRFSGYEPGKDIKIEITGSRPGERLSEPLWSENEEPVKIGFPKIFKLQKKETENAAGDFNTDDLLAKLSAVCKYSDGNKDMYRNKNILISYLREAVPSLDEFYREISNGNKTGR